MTSIQCFFLSKFFFFCVVGFSANLDHLLLRALYGCSDGSSHGPQLFSPISRKFCVENVFCLCPWFILCYCTICITCAIHLLPLQIALANIPHTNTCFLFCVTSDDMYFAGALAGSCVLNMVVLLFIMMTASIWIIFRVTGPLWGEFVGHRWIPLTEASDAELWCFLWSAHVQTVQDFIQGSIAFKLI